MQANVSLILNIILLAGVVFAIARIVRTRRQSLSDAQMCPSPNQVNETSYDDIIAVRRINIEDAAPAISNKSTREEAVPVQRKPKSYIRVDGESATHSKKSAQKNDTQEEQSIMMFLLAKENKQLAGYELLQTVLACGLRFGEGHLFHRHQSANGQGPVVCSLAAATPSGVFDMQNIGAFSVRGLCLFMHVSGHSNVDEERFDIMYETAKQLREGLDTYLLDDNRQPLDEMSLEHYRKKLNITDEECAELAE